MNKWTIKKKAEENNELEDEIVKSLLNIMNKNSKMSIYDFEQIVKNATNKFIKEYNKEFNKGFYYVTLLVAGEYYAVNKNFDLADTIEDIAKFKTKEEAYFSLEKHIQKSNTKGKEYFKTDLYQNAKNSVKTQKEYDELTQRENNSWQEDLNEYMKNNMFKLNYCASKEDLNNIKIW